MKTAQDLLNEKELRIVSVSPDATIFQALQKMNEYKIGAILIKENDDVVGIWTERDLMKNVLSNEFDINLSKIKDFMSKDLIKVAHDASIFNMMDIFLGRRLRHLVVERDGKFVGLLSTGDVVKANLMEKSEELEKLNKIVSFDYYSNWQWKKKK